jgi:hypothetical protein
MHVGRLRFHFHLVSSQVKKKVSAYTYTYLHPTISLVWDGQSSYPLYMTLFDVRYSHYGSCDVLVRCSGSDVWSVWRAMVAVAGAGCGVYGTGIAGTMKTTYENQH